MKLTAITLLITITITAIAIANNTGVSLLGTEGLAGWEQKSFKGKTEYSVVHEGERTTIKAHSSAAASGLFRKVQLDPVKYRYLHWRWKVAGPLVNGAEKTKAGDDYSARVYVVFPGFFFWQTTAITYVWASRLPAGESFANPYTGNAMTVVAESGTDRTGSWVTEQRDILADYRRLFGREPRKLGAVAIMTDTDNTGGEATAWYGDITLSTLPHPAQ